MERFKINKAKTKPENIVLNGNIRISVLSDDIIRVEKVKSGNFVDLCSQTVLCRDSKISKFESFVNDDFITIKTHSHTFIVNKKSLKVTVDGVVAKTGEGVISKVQLAH